MPYVQYITVSHMPSRTVVHLWSFYRHSSSQLRLNKATERMPCGWRANPRIKSQGSHAQHTGGDGILLMILQAGQKHNAADIINASFFSVGIAAKENNSGRPSTFTKSDRTIDQVLMCHREKTRCIDSVSSTPVVVKSLI